MNELDYTTDPTEGEDDQLEIALAEYAREQTKLGLGDFVSRMAEDDDYKQRMGKGISEMAMLFAGAAVTHDEAEFAKMRRRILFEARKDDEDTKQLRHYYLDNHWKVDMDPVIDTEEDRLRYEERVKEFHKDYAQQHPVAQA